MTKASVSKMKELTKKAEDQNKILSVSEAFRMYPVEEEKHKGKLEYCLKGEQKNDMWNWWHRINKQV